MLIIVPAIIVAVIVGMPLGIIAARYRQSVVDPAVSSVALLGFSVPVFVIGLLLVYVFSIQLGWLPANGYVDPRDDFPEYLKRSTLPIIALSLGPMALTMRMTRSSMLEQLGLDYVRTARAKGFDRADDTVPACVSQRAPADRHDRRPPVWGDVRG